MHIRFEPTLYTPYIQFWPTLGMCAHGRHPTLTKGSCKCPLLPSWAFYLFSLSQICLRPPYGRTLGGFLAQTSERTFHVHPKAFVASADAASTFHKPWCQMLTFERHYKAVQSTMVQPFWSLSGIRRNWNRRNTQFLVTCLGNDSGTCTVTVFVPTCPYVIFYVISSVMEVILGTQTGCAHSVERLQLSPADSRLLWCLRRACLAGQRWQQTWVCSACWTCAGRCDRSLKSQSSHRLWCTADPRRAAQMPEARLGFQSQGRRQHCQTPGVDDQGGKKPFDPDTWMRSLMRQITWFRRFAFHGDH